MKEHVTVDKRRRIFRPGKLAGLELKNRVIRAGCFEGMCQGGQVTEGLIEHHHRIARGGVAMTTLAYVSISHDGRAFDHELWMRPEILADLRRLTDAVHAGGAAASIQLGHCGFFTNRKVIGERPLGASPKFCLFTRSYCREMTETDMGQKADAFAQAALLAQDAGFDAVEIHAGHGYLLSQFLSPWTNLRQDEFGGNLSNRLKFPSHIIEKTKQAVGEKFPVLVKINQMDGMAGGIDIEDAVVIAQALEKAGADALVPSSGFTAKVPFLMLRGNLPVREMSHNQSSWLNRVGLNLFGRLMVPKHPYSPLFQLPGTQRIADAVSIPVIYVGGVESLDGMAEALDSGCEFVQLGRATIQDPDFVKKLESGELTASECDHCNRCVAAMDAGGVYCVSNETGFLGDAGRQAL